MNDKKNNQSVSQAIESLADQIAEDCKSQKPLAMVGVRSGGNIIAKRLVSLLKARGIEIEAQGVLDITLYRDDLDRVGGQAIVRETEINFDQTNYIVILVDDVIFTGRSIRAALNALTDLGRAKAIKLAVLVDRGERELPIQPDYVGLKLEKNTKHVEVQLTEADDEDRIILRD